MADEFREFCMTRIKSLDGIAKGEHSSDNQRRWARRKKTVYFECLAKYNEIKNREAANV